MAMNGVVLWSCAQTFRAIVWCEDQGHLAYARGKCSFVAPHVFPSVGDLIAFDLLTVDRVRHARAIRVVERDSYPDIARTLHGVATMGEAAANTPAPRPQRYLAAVG